MGLDTGLTAHQEAAEAPLDLFAGDHESLAYTCSEPAREPARVALPPELHADVAAALQARGLEQLYEFQAAAVTHALAGRNVVLTAGTGSGKSLCYHLPIADRLRRNRGGRALYLAPTKALAQDQARQLLGLRMRWLNAAVYDGDTPRDRRAAIRSSMRVVLTNPDMLSVGMLPAHGEWASFFARLEVVVIDESHVYRGVFGSHVANVIRRLRRICAAYGAHPTFLAASGTIANPAEHFSALTGLDAQTVGDDGAPRSAADIVLMNPPWDAEEERRDSPLAQASDALVRLVTHDVPTIVFARTRKSCELINQFARERLRSLGRHDLARRIAPYRAGYTPEQRRETERALADGTLLAVVATNALELGIDIGSLQACVVTTWPGTMISLRQQWGRAGRRGQRSLRMLIAGDDQLDQYFMRNPEELVARPVERATLNPTNLRVLAPHLAAAAVELPVGGPDDEALFGASLEDAVGELERVGALRRAPKGAIYTGRDSPAGTISLRSGSQRTITIVERDSGQVVGTVEYQRAFRDVYPGALYLHRGESFVVDELDPGAGVALVHAERPGWYTMPRIDTDVTIVSRTMIEDDPECSGVEARLSFGMIEVSEQLTSYQRKSSRDHGVLDTVPCLLAPHSFVTEAIWYEPPARLLHGFDAESLPGTLHAAEHAMIGMLPLLAMCDRNDIGGLSTALHPQTAAATVFIYDGHEGGVGITEAGFVEIRRWVEMTRDAVHACPCADGCPSCVQSPKCGNLNEPLDKRGALVLLTRMLGYDR